MFRVVATTAGHRAGQVGGPATFVKCMGTEGRPEFRPNQAYLQSLITDMADSSSKKLGIVRARLTVMDRSITSALIKHKDTVAEVKRQVHTTSWGILVVFSSFALSAFHLIRKK